MSRFELKAKDGMARYGKFITDHGTVKTPLLMPVVHPAKSAITPKELRERFNFEMVITNSYIIHSRYKFKEKALSEGVHSLIDFDGPIMTDSGTFQMYFHSLPSDEIDPLEIVRFQNAIGSDIGTILDIFSDLSAGRKQIEEDMELSLQRARDTVNEKGEMLLAGTVQGGTFPDLRGVSAKCLAELNLDVHPIGGVVPLMERYRYADIVEIVMASKRYLPPERPVHLFGCGHPMFFAQAALLGCDFFDSASYAKFAESGRMMLTSGTVHLKDLQELPCNCPICSKTTADDIKQMKKDEQDLHLMAHNLYVSAGEIRRIRQAILSEKLFELVAIRARGHPALMDALEVYLKFYEEIEKWDIVGRTASILYTGPETILRPELRRFHDTVLERYPYKNTETVILIPDSASRPFFEPLGDAIRAVHSIAPEKALLFFVTPFGIVPSELEHIHPAQQCVFPNLLDRRTKTVIHQRVKELLQSIDFKQLFWLSRDIALEDQRSILEEVFDITSYEKMNDIVDILEEDNTQNPVRRKQDAITMYQWNLCLDSRDYTYKRSRSTGKIRHIIKNDAILFTLVPTSGLLTPNISGGHELLDHDISKRYKVIMNDDAAPFVAKGKSALAKFVKDAHHELRAGEEVLLLDETDSLLGVGRAQLSGYEMLRFERGVAVNPRHAAKNSA